MRKSLIGLALAFIVFFSACGVLLGLTLKSDTERLDSISVEVSETTLYQGQTFESLNPVVTGRYLKGKQESYKEIAEYTVSDFDNTKLGAQTAVIKYENKTFSLKLNVVSIDEYYSLYVESAKESNLYQGLTSIVDNDYELRVNRNTVYKLEGEGNHSWLVGNVIYKYSAPNDFTKVIYNSIEEAWVWMGCPAVEDVTNDYFHSFMSNAMFFAYLNLEATTYQVRDFGSVTIDVFKKLEVELSQDSITFTAERELSMKSDSDLEEEHGVIEIRITIDRSTKLFSNVYYNVHLDDAVLDGTMELVFGEPDIPVIPQGVEWEEIDMR